MDNRLRHLAALRYFEAAARHQSYSKAALELHISQAAVSQKIRQLEDELACKLFVRQGLDMRLTAKGTTLYQQVSNGFEHILNGLNAIQSEPLEGMLTVNTTPSFASRWLMPKLWKFTMEHPLIPIRVYATTEHPVIKYGEVDVAIRQGLTTDLGANLCKEVLYEEAVYPFCSPELAGSMQLTHPEQLLQCWLIHGVDTKNFTWKNWFHEAGVEMSEEKVQWMEVGTFDMGLSAVMAGHGVCLGTDSLAGDFVERGLLVKPFDIGMSPGVRYTLFHDPGSSRRARIEAFTGWLHREVAQLSR
ncbi:MULTISPECIES: LysR substrate-binding domain-containing protein [unclassified Vibrio]|uniref:LysR substrate-binding domain-containing protein n=1 Tax=unclassified Vibrio TaxID=2614977 RepID=UPI001361AB94|nr:MULTISPECIES: LysR substrate-binding domain-containing protein [unclassified Vibrio]NAW59247.1 LysR family transcriptional regulator [Vibrio sp. V36_P2S2PM302]NAX26953.1 LysR family transcriptional regulator [Vibrio sp. V38_P2S17PM301]NAX30901.1 LysR family transcriptional regulator [Vibrio sp. V37_P2S8PM304]